ncbi:MAG: acyl-CoA desaturase [Saprospiraceae bacterium]|nr:acyl-CoA desaturase [Saprospiraceae bacterium]
MNSQTVKFKSENLDGFYATLRKRADLYFNQQKLSKKGDKLLFIKALILIVLYINLYTLIFKGGLVSILAYIGMGFLAVPLILNIGHEAAHNTFSSSPILNTILVRIFNILGAEGTIWQYKHTQSHHVFPNIAGMDMDIAQNDLARIAPTARYLRAHRFQHVYMPFLYLIYTLNWLIYRDFKDFRLLFSHSPRRVWQFIVLLLSKVFYFSYILILPLLVLKGEHSTVWMGFMAMQFTMSATTFLVLVSAHVGESAIFPVPDTEGRLAHTWSEHQLITTTDFAPENTFVTHLFGGFNHHVVHHLFPNVSHIHYPALTKLTQQTADEFGIHYRCFPTIRESVISHFYFLKKNGLPPDFFEHADI